VTGADAVDVAVVGAGSVGLAVTQELHAGIPTYGSP
jgi:hypothetical protein